MGWVGLMLKLVQKISTIVRGVGFACENLTKKMNYKMTFLLANTLGEFFEL